MDLIPTTLPTDTKPIADFWSDERRVRQFFGRAKRFGLPKMHAESAFAQIGKHEPREYCAPWEAVFNAVAASHDGYLFALCGIRGNGKTQMGVDLLAEEIVNQFREDSEATTQPRYTTAAQLMMEMRDRNSETGECGVFRKYTTPRLLVIDEIHERAVDAAGQVTPFEARTLTAIVDKRYGDGLDTLLIGNVAKRPMLALLGPSIVSRIDERGAVIECTWPSFRVKA